MQGSIFTSFSEMVIEKMGMECWNELIYETQPASKGVYTAGAQYADSELVAMVVKLSSKTGTAVNELLGAFGEYTFGRLYQNSPADLSSLTNLRDFILAVDDVIHSEVKRVHPDAYLPTFEYFDIGNGDLKLHYFSKRKLCHVAIGLIRGAAVEFAEQIEITHPICMRDGSEHCELIIQFKGKIDE